MEVSLRKILRKLAAYLIYSRCTQDQELPQTILPLRELSDVGLDDIDEGNKDFTNWLIEYNNYRPHESLDYLTPLEYAQQNFYKVLPMWSARTITFLFCLVC